MNEFLDILVDIASTPAILVALIAVLGNVLQKKTLPRSSKGASKHLLGFSWSLPGLG